MSSDSNTERFSYVPASIENKGMKITTTIFVFDIVASSYKTVKFRKEIKDIVSCATKFHER